MTAAELGALARWALMEEAETTPKPGLVDRETNGAHRDMDFSAFRRSVEALEPWFSAMAELGMTLDGTAEDLFLALRPVGQEAEQAIRSGGTAGVYTSRKVLRAREDSAQENLNLSVRISRALTSVVEKLTVRPGFLVAKGGITSSDVGIRALGVRRAWVLGQAAPGVPVWRTGAESRFPGLSYVIFPGNVGDVNTLRDVVQKLMEP